MTFRGLLVALCALVLASNGAMAQRTDSTVAHTRTVRFTGKVASILTTRSVSLADVRIVFIDSVHADKNNPTELGEVFIDSAKSRVGITDTSGAFVIRNVEPGHYVMNVRRLGFEPFEGLLTIDTLSVDMELALNQIAQVLPRVTITDDALGHVNEKLDRVGFNKRTHMGTSGIFVDRKAIVRHNPITVGDLLRSYGVGSDAIISVDRMESDWDTMSEFPVDIVVGVEIYRRRGSLPTEFDRTRKGKLAMGPTGSGGIAPPTVLIWTYIP